MRVAALWRYPVKSLQGESLEEARLTRAGIPGDRRWAFRGPGVRPIVGPNASAKQYPELMLGKARLIGPREVEITWPNGVSPLKRLRLHRGAGHFDSGVVHLVTTGSLRALAADARRFRPNVVLEGEGEAGWLGRSVSIGAAVLRVKEVTRRCVMVTHPQPGLPRDLAVLKAVARDGFGVYAEVLKPGLVRVGDRATLLF